MNDREHHAALLDVASILRDLATATGHWAIAAQATGIVAALGDTRHEEPTAQTLEQMAREFNRTMGAPSHRRGPPNVHLLADRHRLRLDITGEEFIELGDALGFDVQITITKRPGACADTIAAADACTDIIYATATACDEWGMPIDRLLAEVHRSNMSKTGGGERADGKIRKGPNYTSPSIAEVLGLVEPATTVSDVVWHKITAPFMAERAVAQEDAKKLWMHTTVAPAINPDEVTVTSYDQSGREALYWGPADPVAASGAFNPALASVETDKDGPNITDEQFAAMVGPPPAHLAAKSPRYVVKPAAEMVAGQTCVPFAEGGLATCDWFNSGKENPIGWTWKMWDGKACDGRRPAIRAIIDTLDPVPVVVTCGAESTVIPADAVDGHSVGTRVEVTVDLDGRKVVKVGKVGGLDHVAVDLGDGFLRAYAPGDVRRVA